MSDVGWTARLLDGLPLTAASFIVTVYGDAVLPRGEVLWTGSLIEICARVGISENLVRTATSRLVAAGKLSGERQGRRSYYRLAETARAEFSEAAHLLYAAKPAPVRWFVVYAPGLSEDQVRRHRMARLGGDAWLCPERGEGLPPAALLLSAEAPQDPAALAVLAGFWDLSALQARYQAMLTRFAPLAEHLSSGGTLSDWEALTARLLLVQVYRSALLRDPCLPDAGLPAGWLGTEARALFRQLYGQLSPAADRLIGAELQGSAAPLAETTPQTEARLAALAEPVLAERATV